MNERRAIANSNRKAWIQSGLIHGAALVAVVVSHFMQPAPLEFQTVLRIEMVAPPTEVPEELAQPEELVVVQPDPEPPAPDPEPEPPPDDPEVIEPDPEPEPEPDPVEEEPPVEDTPPPAPDDPPETEEVAEETTADIAAAMDGLIRDFPEYYANIQDRIRQCKRWNGTGRWEATIYFVIHRDGSVSDIRMLDRSGNFPFDRDLVRSVECASQYFGPLPEDMVRQQLPVAFTRAPGRAPEELEPTRDPP